MTDFFGDTGWDGSLDDIEETPVVAATAETEQAEAQTELPVAEAPEETPEAVAEPEAGTDDRERDAQGRFLPKKIEVDDPDVQAFLAKYGDDPVKALKAATEAQRTIGSLNNELGQLRPLAEKLDMLEQRLNQPQAVATQITEDLIDRNPAQATQLAFEQGNQHALGIAFEAWKEEDPTAAAVWVTTQQMQAREAALLEKIGQLESRIVPVAQAQEDTAFAQEVRALGIDTIEQIRQGVENIDPAVAGTFLSLLDSGTQDQKIGALKALHALTSQGREASPATPEAVRDLARETALAADEAIAEAAVVSATATRSEPAGKSMADVIAAEWDAYERPLTDGWNIGR